MRAIILWAVVASVTPLVRAASSDARAAPRCTPAALDASALLARRVTVSPLPGSRDASPQTQISFLGVPAGQLRVREVRGSISGFHSGRLLRYSQGDGASFVPARAFAEGDRVTVHAVLHAHGVRRQLSDTFAVAEQDRLTTTPERIHPGRAAEAQSFRSRPDLHPPTVTVTASSPRAAAGDVFVAPYTGPGQAGPMILDGSGNVVWFKPLHGRTAAADFAVQQYAGRPVLTWWQGDATVHGFGVGTDVIADSSYRKVASVRAGNGLQADLHEFRLTPRGTALITAYEPIACNLSGAGGPAGGAVTDGVLQEVDVRTGLVRMQWTSLDHVGLGESYEHPGGSSPASPWDYFHINSINVDPDGGLLVSARNTWTVYDLNARSGRILWRLGGRDSSFAEPAGARTAWQHDPRELPDGTISVFDNGSSPTVHGQSRGIVLRIRGGRASIVSQFTHSPRVIAESQGNMQQLPNGDWFVGWGQDPAFSEFGPEGTLLFDAHLPAFDQSYRSYRFAWSGTPVHRPALSYQPPGPGPAMAYASWNGATALAGWRVLAGPVPGSLVAVAQAPTSGFETAIPVPAGTVGPDLAVQALDGAGNVLATSATLPVAGLAG
jgi:hypothetical protein